MRKSDKKLNIVKTNLLAEERYLNSKGIIKESFEEEHPASMEEVAPSMEEAFDKIDEEMGQPERRMSLHDYMDSLNQIEPHDIEAKKEYLAALQQYVQGLNWRIRRESGEI